MRERDKQGGGLLGALFDLLTGAVGDVRAALIDEGWFGRRAGQPARGTALPEPGSAQPQDRGLSLEEQWAPRERSGPAPFPADLDLDR